MLNIFCSLYFSANKIGKKTKTFSDSILFKFIELNTFSGNLTTHISDHLPQFLIPENFVTKFQLATIMSAIKSSGFSLIMNFKNDLQDIA